MSLTANFLVELAKNQFQGNIVIEINGARYSQYQVDSGIVIDSDKIGLVESTNISGDKVDVRSVKTSISTASFSLLDKNGLITAAVGADSTGWIDKEIKIYFGFITGSFDWSDYTLLTTAILKNRSKKPNFWDFKAKEATSLLKKQIFTTFDSLSAGIAQGDTTLTLNDASAFPSSGIIKIDEEVILYSGKTDNDLTGLSRGDESSDDVAHAANEIVYLVTEKEDHAVNIMLDIMQNEMGISSSLIDITSFTDIRDGSLSSDPDIRLLIFNITDGLQYFEEQLLSATGCRLTMREGLITLVELDAIDLGATAVDIDETTIDGDPIYNVNGDRIVNQIIVNWNWVEGLNKFTRTNTYPPSGISESITNFGLRKPIELNLKGVITANDPTGSISTNRANRLLARLDQPSAEISLRTQFKNFAVNVGDDVLVTHRFLPSSGGGLGLSELLEVMSKSSTGFEKDSRISFNLSYSSFAGLRLGVITPDPLLTGSITSQSVFDVPDGACYRVGYFLRLWDNLNQVYFSDPANEIVSISGNTITMADPWITTLGPNVRLVFAEYDNWSDLQKARYAAIGDNSGFFLDGAQSYQISF